MAEEVQNQEGEGEGAAAAAAGSAGEVKPNGSAAAPNITGDEGEGNAPPATWPEDWRNRLAGSDAEAMKRLNRFQSPEGVYKSWRSLETRMSSGELKAKLPDDATEEQVAEWRKNNGIPEKADGYQKTVVAGHEWKDEDVPLLTGFFGIAHAANLTQEQVDGALTWYVKNQQETLANQHASDTRAKQALEDQLRTDWGPEYRGNIGLMRRFLENDIPDKGGVALIGARLEDGSRLIDQPWFAKWVVEQARSLHGDAQFVTGDAGVPVGPERRKEIERIMSTEPERYWKDKDMQAEYLRLVGRDERRSSR